MMSRRFPLSARRPGQPGLRGRRGGDWQGALDAVRRNGCRSDGARPGLPDIDGLDVIRRIRDAGTMLPIIVLFEPRETRPPRLRRSISAPMTM